LTGDASVRCIGVAIVTDFSASDLSVAAAGLTLRRRLTAAITRLNPAATAAAIAIGKILVVTETSNELRTDQQTVAACLNATVSL
jgi:hypothetical protein